MMRWLRGSKTSETPVLEEKENVAPTISENGDLESATEEVGSLTAVEVEATEDVKRETLRCGPGRGKKNPSAKRSSAKAATPLRRSTRAKTRKSEGFFDATQAATPEATSITPEAAVQPTPLHPEFSAADEEEMLQGLERQDEDEVPEQFVSHEQADETAAVYQATTLQETTVIQEIEDRHALQSSIQAFDHTNEDPVQAEAATTSSPTPTTSNTVPITSNQPTLRFEDHRAIRPGGLLTSKYAEVPTTTVLGSMALDPAFVENQKSAKRRLAEDEDEGAAGYKDERSAKRMRSKHSREPTGDRSTPIRRSYPSTWDRYEWALIDDNTRDGLDQAMDSDREGTPARSIVDPDIVDREPIIKQEPDELPMKPPASLHSIPLTPAQSISPSICQPPTGPNTAQHTTSQAQITTTEHVDLFYLCIPRTGPNETPQLVSEDELNLLGELQRRARRILSGEKDRVDIRSRLPAWMRNGLSGQQKKGIAKIQKQINETQQKMKASQPGSRGGNVKGKGANVPPVGPKPTPMKHTPAPVMHQQTSRTVAPILPQTQPLAPQQAPPPFGLEPLDYDNLFGPALVYSALEQVNNMLEMFEANVQCSLSGLDLINLQKSTGRVQPPPPPGCVPLSLANQPYTKLAGPSLVHHALQETNEMMRSFGLPQQFALCWKDLQQMQQ